MDRNITPADLEQLAERLRALDELLEIADRFTQHIAGFQLHVEGGEPRNIYHDEMSEWSQLRRAVERAKKYTRA